MESNKCARSIGAYNFCLGAMKMGRECQQGFTLMELAIVLAITAMLAAAAVPNYMTRVNQKRADTTVQDTQAIIDAARAYRSEKGTWPGDATCSNAIQALGATIPPMLAGVSNINRYNYPITTSCTQYTFSVDQNTTQDWDGVVVNGLPGSQIINSSTYQIRTTVGVPGTEPALDGKLSRLASANAEMNRMRTNLLMGNNDINEVNAVNAQTLNAAGAVNAQTVAATGNISTAGYVEFTGTAAEGGGCAKAGLVATTSTGAQLTCQGGKWVKSVIWSPAIVSTGQSCASFPKGSLAFDSAGNLYVCKP
ncbi:prepilin-type N-terminal cleavage/methylation domain-containing protein [Pseudomonas aeruginosa]|uniref:prepilin-type N-terminal cleavage/methylation domain-containing protein n=2 Tax=Pseudomonas aeruginosa TaxID=287 RepID=UPI0022EAF882|nr:prepilin-type N-terminal cleavage/methylation domain-containing protein [Pseudomonas aeruginosa]